MGWFSHKKIEMPKPLPVSSAPMRSAKSEPHILRAYDQTLGDLIGKTLAMGEHVSRMVERCGPVFVDRNMAAARELIEADIAVDRQKDALMQSTVGALARHAPVASDLRLILAAEHVAGNLERIADHAKNIAKRTLSLPEGGFDPAPREQLGRLHRAVSGMLKDALGAFSDADAKTAADVLRRDAEPDALYDDLFHAAVARLQTGKSIAVVDVQALFAGKSMERIGDHATNIAEEVQFLTRGEIAPSTRAS